MIASVVCLRRGNRYHGRDASDSVDEMNDSAAEAQKQSWWQRLTGGLKRSSSALGGAISDLVSKRKLDAETLGEIEDVLIRADLGLETADRIAAALREGRYEAAISPEEVKAVVASEVEKTLAGVARPLVIDAAQRPFVILVVGVNGSGKTTTIGKLAAKFRADGRQVMMAAGDTFRAAAIDQLKIWATRTGSAFIAREAGADAAGLVFDAVAAAKERGADVLLIDTAGRLQNRSELMSELEKILRVIRKVDASAPHAVLLVLDATVGQNALSQVETFQKMAGVTGLVMTKLDGTARGGILVALAAKFKLPVHFIGVGENVEDLAAFSARDFARAIAGIDGTE
jgi:fused signal recognition particle receptor